VTEQPDGGGLHIDLLARLSAAMERANDLAQRAEDRAQRRMESVHQVPVVAPIVLTAGAGTWRDSNTLGPKTGWCWGIRRLAVQNWSAGNIGLYRNDPNGEQLYYWSGPGSATFGRGEILLQPQDSLVWVAAGVTGNVGTTLMVYGAADEFEQRYLPEYLI
jgi:hypothetical protein